ncbi:NAD(P)H-hydrate dehydratase [Pseudoroseomonas globiformis]|uniref:ADP-dependent (S)-NAD(P)H-hydrate dehydratase n=1 Tax=Teichococcus globiformis TaxID=2307229 RepID=A0ABV7G0D2_9PROT
MTAETPIDEALLRANPLPRHSQGDDKNARGTVLVAGGCREVPGAILLAGLAALRAGAGRLQMGIGSSLGPSLGLAMPESRVVGLPETEEGMIHPSAAPSLARFAARADAMVLGPGMPASPEASQLTEALLDALPAGSEGPALVLDAATLGDLRQQREALRRHAGRIVITPHDGEMARLLDTERQAVLADPLSAAREAASLLHLVVVMKGGCTHVVTPDGAAWSCDRGDVGLATSGSGDVLAGLVGALLARGATPLQAALWGVYAHAEAGRKLARLQGPIGFLARELPPEFPAILASLAAPQP